MSNCNCKAEIAAIIREDKTKYPHAEGVALLNRIADRLAPPPATDWRAKCMIGNQSDAAWWVRLTNDDGLFLWYHHTTGWVGEPYQLKQPCYPTESAARAALAAAPEPGVEKATKPNDDWLEPRDYVAANLAEALKIIPKTGDWHGQLSQWCRVNNKRGYEPNKTADEMRASIIGDTKPSPAPAVAFDAEKIAQAMVSFHAGNWMLRGETPRSKDGACAIFDRRLYECYGDDPGADIVSARHAIAAALRAAESAGYARAKAEQTPRKWPEGFNDYHAQNPGHTTGVLRWNQKYGDWDRCQTHQIADGDWWLPQPAAPAAAKEDGR